MDDRLPDRGDVLVRGGEEYTVVDLTKKAVRLLGDTGTIDVPIYRWPDGFAPLVSEQEPAGSPPLRALLVGGDAGGHLDRLVQLAKNVGVDVVAHWPGTVRKIPSKGLPEHVDLVVFLVSHLGHSLHDTVKPLAKSRGLPMALAPSGGFEHALERELSRLGLTGRQAFRGEYELPVVAPAEGVYVWTGSTWTWQEAEELPIMAEESGGEGFVSAVLSVLAVLAAAKGRG